MDSIDRLGEKTLSGKGIDRDEALSLAVDSADTYDLMHAANGIRRKFFENTVSFCSIVNAKSGLCPNDCAFCSQSSHYSTGIGASDIVDPDEAIRASGEAAENGAAHFGLVTSGMKLNKEDIDKIVEMVQMISSENKILPCVSLGELDEKEARALYDAGLRKYHHNLETSREFYPRICSTYEYERKLRTLRIAKGTGLEICCGGIFGLGETWEDRIDMAMAIRDLDAASIPINFLRPVEGTPLGSKRTLEPLEALRIVAIYRFIFPDKTIKVCGGREYVLRDLQSLMFFAGANGAMLGNYLTTPGRSVEEDLQMIRDLGLELDTENGAQS
jgi:biotin synthase